MNILTSKEDKKMKIVEIWFDADYIYGKDENGAVLRQSLLWYPRLHAAARKPR